MIIINENGPTAARSVAERLGQVYGFDSQIVTENLGPLFNHMSNPDGIFSTTRNLRKNLEERFPKKKVLVITTREIYDGKRRCEVDPEEDWLFGFTTGNLSVISTARLINHVKDHEHPVSSKQFLARLETLAVGHVGWGVIRPKHQDETYQDASYVNDAQNVEIEMGPSCTDNTCAMYPVIDVQTPKSESIYLLLGDKKRFDAGLDALVSRIRTSNPHYWLCKGCRESIHVTKPYR